MLKIPEHDNFIVDLRDHTQPQDSKKILNTKYQIPATGLWHFVQYNNLFLVILVVCILAFGSLTFASEDVRDATIGGKQVLAEGVDNTLLLGQDFDNFSMDFTISGIIEDEESYLINYSYVDLDLVDGIWQIVEKEGGRNISKPFRQDLGIYLAGQLSQEAKARIKELKKLQKAERERGETKIVQVTRYSGLIGKVLDLSGAVFPGYEPVKKIELPTPTVNTAFARRTRASGAADNLTHIYNDWVVKNPGAVAELNNDSDSEIATSTINSEEQSVEDETTDNEKTGSAPVVEENSDQQDTPADTGVEAATTEPSMPAEQQPDN